MKKGTYKKVVGDVTEPQREDKNEGVIIPHVCNNLGIMGGGVALGLKRKWPEVEELYKKTNCLGECSFVKVGDNIIVANMIAQNGLISKNNPKPIKYLALIDCMKLVKDWAILDNSVIHCPKFGSLRAGGNFDFVLELIREIWIDNGINVIIYEYKK